MVAQYPVKVMVVGSSPTRCAHMEEKIKLLHPELTGDCSASILKEIESLNKLKEEIYELFEKTRKLESEYNYRSKKLSSLVGTVFEYVREEKEPNFTVTKTNLVFKNVNGGTKR